MGDPSRCSWPVSPSRTNSKLMCFSLDQPQQMSPPGNLIFQAEIVEQR